MKPNLKYGLQIAIMYQHRVICYGKCTTQMYVHVFGCSVVSDSWPPFGLYLPPTPLDPLSMGFSRQEYWNGLPFSPSGDLLNLIFCIAGGFFTAEPLRKPITGMQDVNKGNCWGVRWCME